MRRDRLKSHDSSFHVKLFDRFHIERLPTIIKHFDKEIGNVRYQLYAVGRLVLDRD